MEIAQRVFAEAGYHVTYQAVSWARCIQDARAGRFSGIIAAIPTDAPDFVFPQQPIGISADGYAVRAHDPFRFASPRDLDGRVLGTTSDYGFGGPIGDYLKTYGHDSRRIQFISGEGALQKNLSKLLAGRIDVVLDDESVLRTAIARQGLESRVSLIHGPSADPVFIAFAPGNAASRTLAQTLDSGIARLRATGALAAILAAYHVRNGS